MESYQVKTQAFPARPRSKRRREEGTSWKGTGVSLSGMGHTHPNKDVLDQITEEMLSIWHYDAENKVVFLGDAENPVSLAAFGEVTAGGVGESPSPTPGVFTSIAYANLSSLAVEEMDKIPTAWAAKKMLERIAALEQGGGGGGTWGSITGTLSNQLDLMSALNAKADASALANYQPLATAINTGNIASQSVAYAGNAGTVGGLSASSFAQWREYTSPDVAYDFGFGKVSQGSGSPTGTGYSQFLTLSYRHNVGNTIPDFAWQIFAPNGDDPTNPDDIFVRTSLATTWRAWHKLYHSGNCNNTSTPWSASSLTLAGAITGATQIDFSGKATGEIGLEVITVNGQRVLHTTLPFCSDNEITAGGVGTGGGGGGATYLYQLEDVPDYRVSYRGKYLRAKSDGSGVEWVDVTGGVSSVISLTGDITQSQLRTALGLGNLAYQPDVVTALGYTPYNAANISSASVMRANVLSTYALNGSDNLTCLQNGFSSIPKSVGTAVRLLHGTASLGFGWFLSGYDYEHAFGGWFISDYAIPSWVGVTNGNWTVKRFAFTSDIPTNNNQLTNGAGYITSSAAASTYLPLSGGIMNGDIDLVRKHIIFRENLSDISGGSGEGDNYIQFRTKSKYDTGKLYIGALWNKNPSSIGEADLSYVFIGKSTDDSNNLRIYQNKVCVGTNTVYHSGNCNNASTPWTCSNLTASGNVVASGEVTAGSDARWKHNIRHVLNGIDAIMQLRPSEWEWNSDNHKGSGLIAQQVQSVLPHLVKTDGEGYLHLTYDGLHAYEISAIQYHETEIDRLRRRVNELERQLNIN